MESPPASPSAMQVLATASPLRSSMLSPARTAADFKLSMTPTSDCSNVSPGLACNATGLCNPWSSGEKLSVHYGSDDEDSLCSGSDDEGLALEEVYRFDRDRIAALAQSGACLEELTEAILLDMVGSLESFLTSEQILNVAKSGDGTMENVGIKVEGTFHCSYCNQRFDSEQQRRIHLRFVHAAQQPTEEQEALVDKAATCARRRHRMSILRAVKALDGNDDELEDGEGKPRGGVTMRSRRRTMGRDLHSREPESVDARVQRAVVAAMDRRELSSVLPGVLMDSTVPKSRRRASIG